MYRLNSIFMVVSLGLIGFGKLGEFLTEQLESSEEVQISWIHNRTCDKIPPKFRRKLDLTDFDGSWKVDLVIEVAHPDITRNAGQSTYKIYTKIWDMLECSG